MGGMDPLIRLSIAMTEIWRRRHSRGALVAMGAALVLAIVVVVVEKTGLWPDGWRLNDHVTLRRLP
jgi:hypothetical protein